MVPPICLRPGDGPDSDFVPAGQLGTSGSSLSPSRLVRCSICNFLPRDPAPLQVWNVLRRVTFKRFLFRLPPAGVHVTAAVAGR